MILVCGVRRGANKGEHSPRKESASNRAKTLKESYRDTVLPGVRRRSPGSGRSIRCKCGCSDEWRGPGADPYGAGSTDALATLGASGTWALTAFAAAR
ncbi:MAG: hypothetical protein AMXMBFR64_30150 [Myxococcales bacterium]